MPGVVGVKLVGKSRLEDESDVTDELGGGVATTGGADAQRTILSEAETAGGLNGAVLNTTVCMQFVRVYVVSIVYMCVCVCTCMCVCVWTSVTNSNGFSRYSGTSIIRTPLGSHTTAQNRGVSLIRRDVIERFHCINLGMAVVYLARHFWSDDLYLLNLE